MHQRTAPIQCRWIAPAILGLVLAMLYGITDVRGQAPAGLKAEPTAGELDSNVVARISGFDVPYDWFLHEFRSSFFRYADAGDIRTAAFKPFLERMTLYALARQAGVPDDPAVRQQVREKIDGMRAFMEFQLAMAEAGLITEAFLESRGITPAGISVTDEDLQAFFDAHIRGQPGAPKSLKDVPDELKRRIRQNLAAEQYGRRVSEKIAEWKTDLEIVVNQPLVDSVPLPEMENAPPEFQRQVAP